MELLCVPVEEQMPKTERSNRPGRSQTHFGPATAHIPAPKMDPSGE